MHNRSVVIWHMVRFTLVGMMLLQRHHIQTLTFKGTLACQILDQKMDLRLKLEEEEDPKLLGYNHYLARW